MQFLTSPTAGNDQRSSTKEVIAGAAHMGGTLYALSVVHCFCSLSHETWILDSGASDHMCLDKALLHDISILNAPIMVNLPNGNRVQLTQQGKLRIAQGLILEHVLIISHFKFNLLSIKGLCEQLHCIVQFTEQLCTLQAHFLKKQLVVGRDFKGLYILDKKEIQGVQFPEVFGCFDNKLNKPVGFCNSFANTVHFATWHQRLGHMFHMKMRTISELVQSQHNEKGFVCEICPKAKQRRLPFPSSHI